jgi:outer membrane protein assembly factor BamB
MVFALDANTGRIIWKQEAHKENRSAAGTGRTPTLPTWTTDGERLYASFGGTSASFATH